MQIGKEKKTILVGEDELEIRNYIATALRCQGYSVALAENGEEVISCLTDSDREISLVLLDLSMPQKDGLTTLREIRQIDRELPIIMLSCTTSPVQAAEAMKCGATDFLAKPVSPEELGKAIRRALVDRPGAVSKGLEQTVLPFVNGALRFGGSHIKKTEALLRQIGASDAPVLLQGETGVGKEILARELHARSTRAGKPFVKLNCAALPAELVESELFGYERGAFTGAIKDKPGQFELADGGTIMLDEIGDMDFKLQAKLLQVLQDQEYHRLGGKDLVRVNVRVMAATHCDLETAIHEGQFREDLYYRLNVIKIHVPPLRECKNRILPLAEILLRKHAIAGKPIPAIPDHLKDALLTHDWPGNVRELENVIRKLLVFSDSDLIAEELRFKTRRKSSDNEFLARAGQASDAVLLQVDRAKKHAETEAILAALNTTHWNRKRAADLLQIDYKAFLYKMKKLGVENHIPPSSMSAVQGR
jgi:two-component system response regulator AtoC